MNTKKIIEVLKFIRSTCEAEDRCIVCPFEDDYIGNCIFDDIEPRKWNIEKLEEQLEDTENIEIKEKG